MQCPVPEKFSLEYFGKFYLAPKNKQIEGKSLVYLNFGYSTQYNQSFPSYSKLVLEHICTETQYSALKDEILAYLSRNGLSSCVAQTLFETFFLILPTCFLAAYNYHLQIDLKRILIKHTKNWTNCTVSIENIQLNLEVKHTNNMGYQEDGQVLMQPEMVERGSDLIPSGHRVAAWPPLGYNIILTINNENIHRNWPKLPIGHGPVSSPVMDREISIADELEKLIILKNKRQLTSQEFGRLKSQLLNKTY